MAAIVEIRIYTSRWISYWDKFINNNRYKQIYEWNPDLKEIRFSFVCRFMEPFHITSLACLIEEYYINGITIIFNSLEDGTLKKYLEDVKFLTYWNSRSGQFIPSERKTALALWKINPEMINSYSHEAKEYFEYNYLEDKDLEPLATALTELFMNIFDHSGSTVSGFCLTQIYPNLGKIKFSVCDFGIGIPSSINTYLESKGEKRLLDTECLFKAFEYKFTTQSTPRNRGFGLDTIKTIVQENRGSLRVVANKGLFRIDNANIQTTQEPDSFDGTHFEIILGIDNLTEKSEETEDFDFDF